MPFLIIETSPRVLEMANRMEKCLWRIKEIYKCKKRLKKFHYIWTSLSRPRSYLCTKAANAPMNCNILVFYKVATLVQHWLGPAFLLRDAYALWVRSDNFIKVKLLMTCTMYEVNILFFSFSLFPFFLCNGG